MRKMRVSLAWWLAMLLGLAVLALLNGCAGAPSTPAEAMREAEAAVPAAVTVTAADLMSPTPSQTPTPTETPTPTPTPTPEATPTPDAEAIARELQQWYQAHIGQEYHFYQRFWPKYSENDKKVTDYWYYANRAKSQEKYMPHMMQMLLEIFGEKMDYPLAEKVMALMQADSEHTRIWFGGTKWEQGDSRGRVVYFPKPLVNFVFVIGNRSKLQVIAANSGGSEFLNFLPGQGTAFIDFFGSAGTGTHDNWILIERSGNFVAAWYVHSIPPTKNWQSFGEFKVRAVSQKEIPQWINDIIQIWPPSSNQ